MRGLRLAPKYDYGYISIYNCETFVYCHDTVLLSILKPRQLVYWHNMYFVYYHGSSLFGRQFFYLPRYLTGNRILYHCHDISSTATTQFSFLGQKMESRVLVLNARHLKSHARSKTWKLHKVRGTTMATINSLNHNNVHHHAITIYVNNFKLLTFNYLLTISNTATQPVNTSETSHFFIVSG